MATTDPRIATEGQWQDLINKVKAKADGIETYTPTSVDFSHNSITFSNDDFQDIIDKSAPAIAVDLTGGEGEPTLFYLENKEEASATHTTLNYISSTILTHDTTTTAQCAEITVDVNSGTYTGEIELVKLMTGEDNFTGATAGQAGEAGLVPAPASGDNTKYLRGDGTWQTVSSYSLPPATTSSIGGVIVGGGLTVDGNGTIATDTFSTAEWNALWGVSS